MTLSDPQLSKPLFCSLHPEHVSGPADKEQPRKDLLYKRADLGKRQVGTVAWSLPFRLKKRERDRTDHLMVLPSGVRPAFEVIEPEFGFEILVMLFDRPAVMGQSHELVQRGGGRQRDEIVLAAPRRAQASFAQQPDFWGEPPIPPIGRGRHALRGEVRGPRGIGAIAPLDAPPRARGQGVAERADTDGLLIG